MGYIKESNSEDEKDMYENMETINKIVADKQAGKINGMTVDMFTASAIKQVYDAVNEDNKAKLDDLMKTKEGVLKVANIAMKMLGEDRAHQMRCGTYRCRCGCTYSCKRQRR